MLDELDLAQLRRDPADFVDRFNELLRAVRRLEALTVSPPLNLTGGEDWMNLVVADDDGTPAYSDDAAVPPNNLFDVPTLREPGPPTWTPDADARPTVIDSDGKIWWWTGGSGGVWTELGGGGGTGGGTTVTVRETDGTPTGAADTIQFSQSTGLSVASVAAGVATVAALYATPTQPGVASTAAQSFGGPKTFGDGVVVGPAGSLRSQGTTRLDGDASAYAALYFWGGGFSFGVAASASGSLVIGTNLSYDFLEVGGIPALPTGSGIVFRGQPFGLAWPNLYVHCSTGYRQGQTTTQAGLQFTSGLLTGGTFTGGGGGGITTEDAADAAAALFTSGTHSGITFAYDDAAGRIDATVTGGGGTTILSGAGIPAEALGSVGNYYEDTAAGVLYGPKGSAASEQRITVTNAPTSGAGTYEVGTRVQFGKAGVITRVRYRRLSGTPTTVNVRAWNDDASNVKIADVADVQAAVAGAFEVTLPTPLSVAAGAIRTFSLGCSNSPRLAATNNPVTGTADCLFLAYRYVAGSGNYPTTTITSEAYFVEPVFVPDAAWPVAVRAIPTFGAAGASHARGAAPDPGALAHAAQPYVLLDNATFAPQRGGRLGSALLDTRETTTSPTAVPLTPVSCTFTLDETTTVWILGTCIADGSVACSPSLVVEAGGTLVSFGSTLTIAGAGYGIVALHSLSLAAGSQTVTLKYSTNAGTTGFAFRRLYVWRG